MRRYMRCCGAVILASCGLAFLWRPALAQKGPTPKILVLDIQPRAVSAALARLVTEAVRKTVGRNPRYRLAPRPALRLRAMLLALGCTRLDTACRVKIGNQLGVDQILSGEVARTATGYLLRLQVFEVARKRRLRSTEHELPAGAARADLHRAVADTTAMALGLGLRLSVSSNVEGAILLVNGQPVGTTPATVTEGLHLGTNEIIVRQRGHRDFTAKVDLRPGRPLAVRAVLRRIAPPPPLAGAKGVPATRPGPTPGGKAAPPLYKRWWFWTVVGAVVVGGSVAGALALRGGDASPRVGVEF